MAVTNSEIISIIHNAFDVEYYDENAYQLHDDICDRCDEFVEFLNNYKEEPLRQELVDIFMEKLGNYIPFGEWDSYDKINSIIANAVKELCDAVNKIENKE